MQRTKFKTSIPITAHYDVSEEPMVFSNATVKTIFDSECPGEVFGLYGFYYYTAKWQKTQVPRCTTSYVALGMKWTIEKVRKHKKILLKLGLIEDTVRLDKSNKIIGRYIKVNFISHPNTKTIRWEKPWDGNPQTEVLRNSRKEEEKEKYNKRKIFNFKLPITSAMFDLFWELYPKKADKGKAEYEWDKVCQRKSKPAPSWEVILEAVTKQKQTERWNNPKFIPHASTWIHQSRWNDDPSEMTSYDRDNDDDYEELSELPDKFKSHD